MIKSSLIQLALIILGLIAIVSGLESLLGSSISFIAYGFAGYESGTIAIVVALLMTGGYMLIGWLLISQSKDWSIRIVKLTRVDPEFSIRADPSQIIFLLLICIGVYSLIHELPVFLQKLYEEFSTRVTRLSSELDFERFRLPGWPQIFLKNIMPLLLILLARPISIYFAQRMSEQSQLEIQETEQTE